jgi:parvulin-like peptidyl-prolyl isomerase
MRSCSILVVAFLAITASLSASAAGTRVDADQVVVSRGGVDLTLGDVDAYMQTVPDKDRSTLMSDEHRAETIVLNLLRTKQLAKQAREMKLDQRQDVSYQLATSQNNILAQARMDEFVAGLKMPDFSQLAKELYVSHPKDYVVAARVDVQHILIGTDKHSDLEARDLAEDVRKQAAANPASFKDLVMKYSDDPSKDRNDGIIENATTGKFVPEFVQGAKALKTKDEISPVIKTKYGYHILKLIANNPPRQKTLAEVQPELVEMLKSQYIDKQRVQLLDQMAAEKNVTNPDAFASLGKRYEAPGASVAPKSSASDVKH